MVIQRFANLDGLLCIRVNLLNFLNIIFKAQGLCLWNGMNVDGPTPQHSVGTFYCNTFNAAIICSGVMVLRPSFSLISFATSLTQRRPIESLFRSSNAK